MRTAGTAFRIAALTVLLMSHREGAAAETDDVEALIESKRGAPTVA